MQSNVQNNHSATSSSSKRNSPVRTAGSWIAEVNAAHEFKPRSDYNAAQVTGAAGAPGTWQSLGGAIGGQCLVLLDTGRCLPGQHHLIGGIIRYVCAFGAEDFVDCFGRRTRTAQVNLLLTTAGNE